jgi:hypothetical protein
MSNTKPNADILFAKWRTQSRLFTSQTNARRRCVIEIGLEGTRDDFKGCFAALGRLPFHISLFAVPVVYLRRIRSERVSFYEGGNMCIEYQVTGTSNIFTAVLKRF